MKVNAMVFAAGIGSRLRPLTDTCPKALIEVGGKKMLGRVLDNLAAAGIAEAVVNIHHHAGMVAEFIRSRQAMPPAVTISDESDCLLDTGGGLVKAAPMLAGADATLVHNADIATDVDLAAMIGAHFASGADVTLLAVDRPTSRKLIFDRDGLMTGWLNTATGATRPPRPEAGLRPGEEALGFCGIHLLSGRALEELVAYARRNSRERFSITDFYIDSCAALDIRRLTPAEAFEWHDIGRHATLEAARRAFGAES